MEYLTCSKCGQSEQADKFHKSKRNLSGRSSWCPACHRTAARNSMRKLRGGVAHRELDERYAKDRAHRNFVETIRISVATGEMLVDHRERLQCYS